MLKKNWQEENNSPNKKTLPKIQEGNNSFHNPDRCLPAGRQGLSPVTYSTGTAPSTSTVTLLLSTSTNPLCISK